jgi:hypothetical protein
MSILFREYEGFGVDDNLSIGGIIKQAPRIAREHGALSAQTSLDTVRGYLEHFGRDNIGGSIYDELSLGLRSAESEIEQIEREGK